MRQATIRPPLVSDPCSSTPICWIAFASSLILPPRLPEMCPTSCIAVLPPFLPRLLRVNPFASHPADSPGAKIPAYPTVHSEPRMHPSDVEHREGLLQGHPHVHAMVAILMLRPYLDIRLSQRVETATFAQRYCRTPLNTLVSLSSPPTHSQPQLTSPTRRVAFTAVTLLASPVLSRLPFADSQRVFRTTVTHR